eukprot:561043-Prorocentrum_minimum.AAC.1
MFSPSEAHLGLERARQRRRARPRDDRQLGGLHQSHLDTWHRGCHVSATQAGEQERSQYDAVLHRGHDAVLHRGHARWCRVDQGCDVMRCDAMRCDGMQQSYEAAQWRHSGGTVEAQWRHSGRTVDAQWTHSGGTVDAQWRHSGGTVDAQ